MEDNELKCDCGGILISVDENNVQCIQCCEVYNGLEFADNYY